jgi:hypothetical protein
LPKTILILRSFNISSQVFSGGLARNGESNRRGGWIYSGYMAGIRTWKERTCGVAPLKKGSVEYAKSIRAQATSRFGHEIYSEAKIADQIENGAKELDMKTTHPFGPRSRVAKRLFQKKTAG